MASTDRATEAEEYVPSLYRPAVVLPIAQHKRALQYTVTTFPITILVGETGSGKTTQIPQYLHDAGFTRNGQMIACTQPRRVAATTVAARVAEEMGVDLGEEVGYSIRFEDLTGPRTKIKYMTDGMLLREALIDPLLKRYSVIMVDEAHERSLSTDIILGVLKKIRRKRPDLRLIVSSATLQAEEFLKFFTESEEDIKEIEKMKASANTGKGKEKETENAAPAPTELAKIVGVKGRMYPVDILYLEKPAEDYVDRVVQTVIDIHLKEGDGDILVFLTGREEINRAIEEIRERTRTLHPRAKQILPLPLYAGLSSAEQMAVFDTAPETHRKVVVSTNIAEASVTIDGIAFVVDCGFVKIRVYNAITGIETLTRVPISKASAKQRAGRAGRTKPGKCMRLYTETSFKALEEQTSPEIVRSNLAPVILQLKALGIDNVIRFEYVTAPPAELMIRALELLYALGALDEYAKLTKPLGLRMAETPLSPMLAKVLLNSVEFGCSEQILSIAAMTSVQNVFVQSDENKKFGEAKKRLFSVDEGDHLTLLNVYMAFTSSRVGKKSAKFCHENLLNFKALTRAVSVRNQLWKYLKRFVPDLENKSSELATEKTIRRCLVSGYFAQAAKMMPDGTYRAVQETGKGDKMKEALELWAHPTSVMFNRKAEWVVFHEVVETGEKTYIRDVTKVEKEWLLEYGQGFYQVRK